MKFDIYFRENDLFKKDKLINALKYLLPINNKINLLINELNDDTILSVIDNKLLINRLYSTYEDINVDDLIYIVYVLKKTNYVIDLNKNELKYFGSYKINNRWFLSDVFKQYIIIDKNNVHLIPEKFYNLFFQKYKLINSFDYLRNIKLKELL